MYLSSASSTASATSDWLIAVWCSKPRSQMCTQQALQVRDPHDAVAAERLERVVRELALADVAADRAHRVVGHDAAEGERLALIRPTTVPNVFSRPDRAGDDRLVVHLRDLGEHLRRQVAAVEDDRLVGIVLVVVVPVDERAGLAGRQLPARTSRSRRQTSTSQALGMSALLMHAHDRAGHDAEVLLHRGPALDGRRVELVLASTQSVHDDAERGHLRERGRPGCR